MNFKTLVKLSLSMLFVVAMLSGVSFAQLSTVYVDVTNGSDTYSGANATNLPAGSGPKATLDAGLKAVSNGGKIVLMAGTYSGNININSTTYTNITSGLTIELRQLNSNNVIDFTGSSFTFNVTGGTLNITSANGTESLYIGSTINLTAGNVNIASQNNLVLPSSATINIAGAAAFTGAAPKKGTNVTLSYTGDNSITAGPESNYGDYGTGTLTVNKTAGTSIVFPNAITKVASITVTNGNATFNGAVTSTNAVLLSDGDAAFNGAVKAGSITQNNGTVTFASTVTSTGDVTLATGANQFNGALTLGTSATTNAHLIVNGGTATFSAVTFTSTQNTLNDAIKVTGTATATFNGNVDVKAGDIVVSSSNNVIFNGNVNFGYLDNAGAEGNIGQVVNSSSSAVSFNGTATWNGLVKLSGDRDFAALGSGEIVNNAAAGSVSFANISLNNPNTGANPDSLNYQVLVDVVNGSTGSLTLGTVTAPYAAASTSSFTSRAVVKLTADNAGTGALSLAGDLRGDVINETTGSVTFSAATVIGGALTNTAAASGTITANGSLTVAGVVTNGASKTIALGGNSLTLTGAVSHLTNGGTISATSGVVNVNATSTFDGGTFPGMNIASSKTATFQSNPATIASMTINGSVVANIAVTVSGSTNLPAGSLTVAGVTYKTLNLTQNGGSVTLNGASVLWVEGDFNRTSGTFTANGTSELKMKGAVAQNLNGGPLLNVVNLTFDNTTAPITLGQSVRASGTVTITTNTALVLNTLNIILNANNAAIINNGSYSAVGGGGVIFGGLNTVSGGASISNATIAGTGTYSYITVDVGASDSVTTNSSKVKWNGVLTLKSGDIKVASGHDFAPTGTTASIIRDVTPVTGSLRGIVATAGTFNNDVPTDYDLTYTGALTDTMQITAGTSELDLSHVRNLTVSTTGSKLQLVSTLGTPVVVKGNVTLSDAAQFDLDAATPFTFEVKGVFTANKKSELSGSTASREFRLSSNGITHTIAGTISAASPLTVTGTGVTINGSALSSASSSGYEAVLQDVKVADNASLTLVNIQQIKDSLTTGNNSTLSLGMAAPDSGDGIISGPVTLNGTSATLTSNVEAAAGLTHNKGSFDFGGKKLTMTTAGDYTRTANVSAIYPSTTGTLVLDRAGLSLNLNDGTVPNVEVKANTTIGGIATVSNLFKHTAGTVTLNNNLVVSGNMTYAAGSYAGASPVKFTGAASTVTLASSLTMPNVTVNSTGTVALATSDTAAVTLTVSGAFTHTAGTFGLGINSLSLTKVGAAYIGTAGTFTATTGKVIFAGAGAQTFTPGTALVIPNLTLATTDNAGTVTNSTPAVGFTVSKSLVLDAKNSLVTNAGTLTIGDGATVERKRSESKLSSIPTFGTGLNYIYSGADTTGNELAPVVNNITILNAAVLNSAVKANGKLALSAKFTMANSKVVTLGAGALLELNANGEITAPVVPTGALNLVYNGVTATSSNDWPASANIGSLIIKAATNLHASRTVAGPITLSGNLDLKGYTLTVQGDVTAATGKFFTASAASNLVFAGNTNTNLNITETKEIPANISIKLAKTTGTNTVTLVGGSLDLHKNGSTLYFGNGLIVTGDNYVKLYAPLFGLGQGFDRSAVAASNTSHIVGNVKKQLVSNGTISGSTEYRVEFPTGSATMYRPAAITFNPVNGMSNVPNTTITVSHVDAAPTGTVALPIANGVSAGVDVARYPNFYWNLNSAPSSISPSVAFDLELGAAGFTNFDNVTNIRTIRRNGTTSDVTNPWLLQGGTSSLQYDNNVINSVPTIVVKNAQAGIIAGGAVYTLGLKSNLTVQNPIADKSVTVGSGVSSVVLSSPAVFGGNAGSLTYTAQSSNNSVATVAISGDTLKVTPVAQGSADISVTAQDVNNDFLTTKFKFAVTQVTYFAVSGKVSYDNAGAAALKGVKVTLTSSAKTYTATTDDNGMYSIPAVDNGTYTVTASSTAAWGGVNATDALLVANYYNGSQSLTPLRVAAADVNNSSTVNNTDALQILRRFNNLVTSFAKGDWTFTSPSVTVNGTAVTNANVTGIAVGDVNGSYSPAAQMSKATLSNEGTIKVNPGAQISVPVNADVENLGAASMTFKYAKDMASFTGVSSNLEGVVYNEANGVITVAWANLGKEVVNVNTKSGFITLNFKPTEALKAGKSFGVEMESAEIATAEGKVINTMLKTSEVKVVVPSEFALSQNYPNPFNPTTTINYDLPVNSKVSLVVFDVLGRQVAQLVNGTQDAGSYKIQFNASGLTSGIYFYTLNVSNGDQKFVKTFKMTLMK